MKLRFPKTNSILLIAGIIVLLAILTPLPSIIMPLVMPASPSRTTSSKMRIPMETQQKRFASADLAYETPSYNQSTNHGKQMYRDYEKDVIVFGTRFHS